jgi:hypothetical protein
MNMQKRSDFLGSYFSKDTVLKLASVAKVFSWIVAGFYLFQWFVQIVTIILQISRGFWAGSGPTDVAQSLLVLFEQPLRGLVYFIVLQAMSQALLMFMDMEDNTRKAARGETSNK